MESASIKENLLQEGWNISPSALHQLTGNGKTTDLKTLQKKLLDIDLRTVSGGTLPEDINKTKYETVPGGIVLQIQKVKNLSSPKYQESSNPNASILKFILSDGVQNVQGVGMEQIPNLHVNTLPGSKIVVRGDIEMAHCFLLLSKENTSFLGGRVEQLIEKWELNRTLAKHKRDNQEEGGPPPWIPFGQKISKQILTDKNFKSLDQGKNKENSENAEFEAQRKGAIMEASKIGAVKVFGGGNNKLLDYNVQIIVDAGFTIEQAEYALKNCKNNPDRALRSLQSKITKPGKEEGGKASKMEDKSGKGKGRGRHRDEETATSLKPRGKVSLFDFLEDKLPVSDKEPTTPLLDVRNSNEKKPIKSVKPGGEKTRTYADEKKSSLERPDGKPSFRRPDLQKPPSKHDFSDRKIQQDRKPDVVRFDSKRNHEVSRNEKSFGNFKVKNESYSSKNDAMRSNRPNEKRDAKPGQSQIKNYYNKNDRVHEGSQEDVGRKPSNFIPNNEKPPRFQKYQQQNQAQQNEVSVPQWNDSSYGRMSQQSDFQLQNSLANLTLQQNIAIYPNQNSYDHIGVPSNGNKNIFYQNMMIPSTPTTESHRPQAVPVPSYPNRPPPAGYLQPELKPTAYPGMPNVPDFPFKGNGAIMPGFNEFQASFGSTPRTTNAAFSANNYNSNRNSYNNPQGTYNNTSQANYISNPSNYNTSPNNFTNSQPTFNNSQSSYNAQNTANNFSNFTAPPTFMSAPPIMQPPPQAPVPSAPPIHAPPPPPPPNNSAQPRRWSWKKGQKCFARYWEDQNYYNAVVTGVSDNTCVVKFTEYGNYEEVLQNDCIPIPEMPPES